MPQRRATEPETCSAEAETPRAAAIEAERIRREIFRRMTPTEKLEAASRLWTSARELKAAALRATHPDWTEEQIWKEVRRAFLLRPD
ncbi:MAG: hypothetical protein HY791_16955 [Deltaproteobacteria bacterium]|nr:hypothetical protein [Deltaproteobacteria bacterium]